MEEWQPEKSICIRAFEKMETRSCRTRNRETVPFIVYLSLEVVKNPTKSRLTGIFFGFFYFFAFTFRKGCDIIFFIRMLHGLDGKR